MIKDRIKISAGYFISGNKKHPYAPLSSLWYKFQVVSASFRNFLSLEYKAHEPTFYRLLNNQKQAYAEQSLSGLPDNLKVRFHGYTLRDIKERPGIICTFHSGSFRMIGHYLAKNGIPFVLLVSKNGLQQENELVNRKYDERQRQMLGFDLIDANDRNSVLKISRELRNGKSILIYMDGNTGAGDETASHNLLSVPFLNQRIRARAGAAFISYLASVPIYPVISTRQWTLVPCLDFFPPILPDKEMDRQVFVKKAVSHIYNYLEKAVKQKPWQWEAWLYLHEHAEIVHPVPEQEPLPIPMETKKKRPIRFNEADYSFFNIKGRYFLFRKSDYQCFEIEHWLYLRLFDIYRQEYTYTVPKLQRNHMGDLVANSVVLEIQ
ncbi:hypothetical protein GCM10023231_20240 [Olivibacter ginsenosidimutans]|uniref:Lauroyl acyltransferase n=1 Tax=Olivibacter ginsenosidimutans TaxID=1176537 RepID=A0ABP9B8T0_9SPHI